MASAMPQVAGVEHSLVAAGGIDFHVAQAGRGEPVLLLHGWPQHWYCWRLVMPRLAERHRVIALDLRGFGWSSSATEGFEKESLADDVVRVLAALGLDRVRLVGHDWGGWIGYLLALRRPDVVERLVTLAIPPPHVRVRLATLAALPRLRYQLLIASPLAVPLFGRPGYVMKTIERWSRDRAHLDREVRRTYARGLRPPARARAAMLMYRTFLRHELGPVLAGRYRRPLEVPTLVLHGTHDPILPPALFERLEDAGGKLRTERVAGAGHMLPEERPELVADRALSFFAAGAPA